MPSIEYSILRTTEDFDAFRPVWSDLWRQDGDATPFQRPEWLLPWWHYFGSADPRAVVIWRNGAAVGVVPFYIYVEPTTGERRLLLMGVGTTDYLGGVFAASCSGADVARAIAYFCERDDWDVLYASQLMPHAKLSQALSQGDSRIVECLGGEECSRMAAVPMGELPAKIRRNAMYYRNRAMRSGALELTTATAADWAESLDALVRLHSTRWQERGESGVLADPRVLAWHREAIPELERSGCLRLCTLRLGGEAIGVLYSLIDPPERPARTQYVYLTAFSNKYADLRPGTVLLALAIDQAAREGVQVIDMLRGDEVYKRIWHTDRVPTSAFRICRTRVDAIGNAA